MFYRIIELKINVAISIQSSINSLSHIGIEHLIAIRILKSTLSTQCDRILTLELSMFYRITEFSIEGTDFTGFSEECITIPAL